jgi:hypothetical protein
MKDVEAEGNSRPFVYEGDGVNASKTLHQITFCRSIRLQEFQKCAMMKQTTKMTHENTRDQLLAL